MRPQNENYQHFVRNLFDSAPYIQSLGVVLTDLGGGWVETEMVLRPNHLQQNGFVHAGVQATLADHSAGAAAATLVRPNVYVLTIEFKINLLRPAKGRRLRCRAEVLKIGRTLSVVESTVYAQTAESEKLVSKATVTIAHQQAASLPQNSPSA